MEQEDRLLRRIIFRIEDIEEKFYKIEKQFYQEKERGPSSFKQPYQEKINEHNGWFQFELFKCKFRVKVVKYKGWTACPIADCKSKCLFMNDITIQNLDNQFKVKLTCLQRHLLTKHKSDKWPADISDQKNIDINLLTKVLGF